MPYYYTDASSSQVTGTPDVTLKLTWGTKAADALKEAVSKTTSSIEGTDDSVTTFSALGFSLMGENDDAEEYYAEFEHPEYGKCCLYFNPNSNFREALEPFLSREMKIKLNKH